MKFCNRLKSLTWNLFVKSWGNRRLRRRRPNWAPITLAAEMLEVRALLSGPTANVTAVVSGTALTLTGDNLGNHGVAVYRVDANHIEIDSMSVGTTING